MSLKDDITPEIKPGNDFFSFVNQRWIDTHPIPDDRASVGAFETLGDENIARLKTLIEQPTSDTDAPNIALAKHYYRVAMDEAGAEARTADTVTAVLTDVAKLTDPASILAYAAERHAHGKALLWDTFIDLDDKNSQRYIAAFTQGGISLPDRDYYLDATFADTRQKYEAFLTAFFELIGQDEPAVRAKRVLELETLLAEASMTRTEQRNPERLYNPFNLTELAETFPDGDWAGYFQVLGFDQDQTVIVNQPDFVTEVFKLLSTTDRISWHDYLAFHSLLPIMNTLSAAYVELNFSFYGKVLSGTTAMQPRYRRIIRALMDLLPEPIGQLFVESHFDEAAKASIYDLVTHLQEAFGKRIDRLDWMSDTTKTHAHAKLATFLPLLGYPDTWRDYSKLILTENYTENFLAVYGNEWHFMADRIKAPVDRHQWLMSPVLVNACYWPNVNSITFPAGILQPPYFDARGDFASNYGSIGAVIGHEITHGFDDQGSQYDPEGNLKSWWTPEDRAAFDKRAEVLVKQFDSYKVGELNVNGQLTLGENIADLGGLLMAYDAFQAKLSEIGTRDDIDGFTPEQRFFIAYAVSWHRNVRPEMAKQAIVSDPHAPSKYRTNGTVRNMDEFYAAFDTQPGDLYYLAPDDRVRIW